jgi:hypothetical protein
MIHKWIEKVKSFETDAHKILSIHESSKSRLIILEDTYKRLTALSLRQDDLLKQALRCIESNLFRAAHVMAWAGFMDFIEDKICSDGSIKLKGVRPNWKFTSIDELRELVPEYQIIEVTRELKLCTKTQVKALIGMLNKRNECAHPSIYYPGLNESLGYISEILQRITNLQAKIL